MNSMGVLTLGTVMFLAGIVIAGAGVLLSIVTAATSKKRKQKMEERMREKY